VVEHGRRACSSWSSARVAACRSRPVGPAQDRFEPFRKAVEQDVRFANITIIEGIGRQPVRHRHGLGRVAEVILRDERAVFPPAPTIRASAPRLVAEHRRPPGRHRAARAGNVRRGEAGARTQRAASQETARKYLRAKLRGRMRAMSGSRRDSSDSPPLQPRPALRPLRTQTPEADAPADTRGRFHRPVPGPLRRWPCGHHVTIFNRGRQQETWPGPVEELLGDRNGRPQALEGGDWDVCIDNPTIAARSGCATPPRV